MNLVPATLVGMEAPPGAVVGIRPQDVVLGACGTLRAIVDSVESRGHDHLIHLRLGPESAELLLAVVAGPTPPPSGVEVSVTLSPDRLHLFDGPQGRRVG